MNDIRADGYTICPLVDMPFVSYRVHFYKRRCIFVFVPGEVARCQQSRQRADPGLGSLQDNIFDI